MSQFESFYCENYQRMLDIFHSSLFISIKYFEEDVVYKKNIIIYRDVNRFLTNLESKTKKHFEVQSHLIVRYCFQDSVEQ